MPKVTKIKGTNGDDPFDIEVGSGRISYDGLKGFDVVTIDGLYENYDVSAKGTGNLKVSVIGLLNDDSFDFKKVEQIVFDGGTETTADDVIYDTALEMATSFDQDVTPDFFNGSGNDNGAFTLAQTSGGLELGLRGKIRFNESGLPENTFNSNGDGTYTFEAGLFGPNEAQWAFEWSINTDYDDSSGKKLNDYSYLLELDGDPTDGTDFQSWDPINVPSADHTIGDNTSTDGFNEFKAVDEADYANLIDTYNVAQQSWRYGFFDGIPGTALENFDPTATGTYTIRLSAYEDTNSNGEIDPLELVGVVSIDILVESGMA